MIRYLILLTVLLYITGCENSNHDFSSNPKKNKMGKAQRKVPKRYMLGPLFKKPLPIPNGKSMLYVFREEMKHGKYMLSPIYVDGKIVNKLIARSCLNIALEPGAHTVSIDIYGPHSEKNPKLTFVSKANENIYIGYFYEILEVISTLTHISSKSKHWLERTDNKITKKFMIDNKVQLLDLDFILEDYDITGHLPHEAIFSNRSRIKRSYDHDLELQ